MRRERFCVWVVLLVSFQAYAQVDTTFIYNNNMPYGSVDLRLSKSPSHAYYLKEGQTFSFRESPPGTRTSTWLDMTAWDSSPYQEGNLREKDATGDRFVMNYRFLVPQGYDENY